jgi:hypothetical protein
LVVVNEANEILMIRRTDNGNWTLPGGAIYLGESVAQSAAREALHGRTRQQLPPAWPYVRVMRKRAASVGLSVIVPVAEVSASPARWQVSRKSVKSMNDSCPRTSSVSWS